jgi:carboxymethylenebutenolidase
VAAVIEEYRVVESADGPIQTFFVRPDEGAPFPLVLFLMDAYGKRAELHDMARRLATSGYSVALPNLYHRRAAAFAMDPEDPASFQLMLEFNHGLTAADVRADAHAILADLAGPAGATHTTLSRIGVIGYCMAGPFAIDVANHFPQVAGAASIFGVRLQTEADDSPHLRLPQTRAEIYVGSAETDPYAPAKMVETFRQSLVAAGVTHRVEYYAGEHGSVFPSRAAYNKQVAELHWHRLLTLLERTVKRG